MVPRKFEIGDQNLPISSCYNSTPSAVRSTMPVQSTTLESAPVAAQKPTNLLSPPPSPPCKTQKQMSCQQPFLPSLPLFPLLVLLRYLLTTRFNTPTTNETLSRILTTLASIHLCCRVSILFDTFLRIFFSSSSICCSSFFDLAFFTISSRPRRARERIPPEKADHLRPAKSRRGLKYVCSKSTIRAKAIRTSQNICFKDHSECSAEMAESYQREAVPHRHSPIQASQSLPSTRRNDAFDTTHHPNKRCSKPSTT